MVYADSPRPKCANTPQNEYMKCKSYMISWAFLDTLANLFAIGQTVNNLNSYYTKNDLLIPEGVSIFASFVYFT